MKASLSWTSVLIAPVLLFAGGEGLPEEDDRFWSFRRPVKPAVPEVRERAKVRTPVDAFILERLEAKGTTLNPEAERRVLIRRLYFDLIGLAPSPEEVEAFVSDSSPTAYEKLVDRLLASPHHGERWGRHWLDVAGYAESNGILGDAIIPDTWGYRDYVIRALNTDKPYDRFLLEQFAGDELVDWRSAETLTGAMVEALTATGFLRCTPDGTDNQNIFQLEKRWDRLHVVTEVSMKATLGLVLNCARCHDHKFDPITQEDYYKLVALFTPAYNPEDWVPSNDFRKYKWPLRYILKAGKTERREIDEVFASLPVRVRELQREKKELYAGYREKWLASQGSGASGDVTPEALEVSYPDLKEAAAHLAQKLDKEEAELKRWQERVGRIERIWALWDTAPDPPVTRILERGDFMKPARAVEPGIPSVLDDPAAPFRIPQSNGHSSGRRLAFARWLVRPEHPLTARVIVNRVWHYHFGRGIVGTPDDFGSQGARPTHPQLLDWLAIWFTENGWSLKKLHRLLLVSGVYRQSVALDPRKKELDPENYLFWRLEPRRLEAELIRDAMLATGGDLDLKLYGRPVPVKQAADGQYVVDAEHSGRHRRSIYILNRRTTLVSFLEVFDLPQIDTNVPDRFESTVPLQSLSLMNNPFVLSAARRLAERLAREVPRKPRHRIERAFQIAFSRSPSDREIEMSLELLGGGGDRAEDWEMFCQGLLVANEFLYVN